jgi:AcrR family transcriptional regulator
MTTVVREVKSRKTKQLRGKRARDSILDAAQRLLAVKSFEAITLAELVKEAGSSVGSFYHFFESKRAMLSPLYARYDRALTEDIGRVFAASKWEGRSLSYRCARIIRLTVWFYRQERGLMQALVLHARRDSEDLTDEQQSNRAALYDRIVEVLLECRDEITHRDPESAIRLGILFVGASCREKVLFPAAPAPKSVLMGDREMTKELTEALLSYLRDPRSTKENRRVS